MYLHISALVVVWVWVCLFFYFFLRCCTLRLSFCYYLCLEACKLNSVLAAKKYIRNITHKAVKIRTSFTFPPKLKVICFSLKIILVLKISFATLIFFGLNSWMLIIFIYEYSSVSFLFKDNITLCFNSDFFRPLSIFLLINCKIILCFNSM